jgi:carbon storage regulator
MLVLSRKPGEKIMIGQDIVLIVLEVRGDNIKLGVQAPRSVTVHREEIYEEIRKANMQAAPTRSAEALPNAASVLSQMQLQFKLPAANRNKTTPSVTWSNLKNEPKK